MKKTEGKDLDLDQREVMFYRRVELRKYFQFQEGMYTNLKGRDKIVLRNMKGHRANLGQYMQQECVEIKKFKNIY